MLSDVIKLYFREAFLAIGLVFLLLGSMWLATGMFPPMVVVESGSMKHTDEGSLGSIDPGDLVLVMNPNRVDIITFVEAADEGNKNYGYEMHGMYGDVIIYQKNGGSDTPVIHRALLKAVLNSTNEAEKTWDVPGTSLVNVSSINLVLDYPCSYHGGTFNLEIINWIPNHSGYLTTGDNPSTNGCKIDQIVATGQDERNGLKDENNQPVTAVQDEWIVGVASSEIPWVGSIKLFFSGTSSFVSAQTWSNLMTLIAVIVIVPMIFDLFYNSNDEEE